jgi:outer membrane protein assembly factor BamB
MNLSHILVLGTQGHVAAFDKKSGSQIWRTDLKDGALFTSGNSFVTVLIDADKVYVHAHAELYGLDLLTGQKLWHNPLKGFGMSLGVLAIGDRVSPAPAVLAEDMRMQRQSG